MLIIKKSAIKFHGLLWLLALSACGEDRITTTQDTINSGRDQPYAVYNISAGDIPFPNLALFGTDGTLNIPDLDESDYSNPQVAMNASWGFSTNAPITVNFSESIDASTLVAGVKLYKLNFDPTDPASAGPAFAAISGSPALNCGTYVETQSYGSQYFLRTSGNTLVISPLQPLQQKSMYLAVVTDSLKTQSAGSAFQADTVYSLLQGTAPLYDSVNNQSLIGIAPDPADAAALENLRQLTNLTEGVARYCDPSVLAATIPVSWVFNTPNVNDTGSMIQAVQGLTPSAPTAAVVDTMATSPLGAAEIFSGTITVPYYLTEPSPTDPTANLTKFWHITGGAPLTPVNPTPEKTADVTIPLLVTKPVMGAPTAVVIFQHGITGNRTNLLGIADALAGAGYAAVAIDLPLHGLLSNDPTGLYQAGMERHFDVDFDQDGNSDTSGKHFINLANLLVTRDNVQQAVADLFALHNALDTMDVGGMTEFNGLPVYFIGHSLGAIVGVPFLTMDTSVQTAVLGMPGGALPKLLDGSYSFGPEIVAGLAANGVSHPSSDYEGFLLAAQTVLDPIDPINYASDLGASSRGIMAISVHGDLVIPNSVADFTAQTNTIDGPLAGTNPLLLSMGLDKRKTSTSAGSPLHVWAEFGADLDGTTNDCNDTLNFSVHHSSLLSPADAQGNTDTLSESVATEMQTEVVTFLATGGTQYVVSNSFNNLCANNAN